MKKSRILAASLFAAVFSIAMTSCSSILGYSTLLWNVNDEGTVLADGTLVPVYIKSNISHTYVIGVPETKSRIEVPLWKLTDPESKSKAKKSALRYQEYQHQYARCVLDGLPIRAKPVNTEKQVYRLRKGEVIRVLYAGKGAVPTNGKSNLEGKWLRVLTENGTMGWCFSYNLRLFEMNADGTFAGGSEEAKVQEQDILLDSLLNNKWYPDYYRSLLRQSFMDLDAVKPEFGFDAGKDDGVVKINLKVVSDSVEYSTITKIENAVYRFEGTPFQVTVRSPNSIVVQYTDEKGMPRGYGFVTMSEDTNIEEFIEGENQKRLDLYNGIRSLGADFRSSNYGTLTFNDGNIFLWQGFSLLVPTVIGRSAKGTGYAYLKYSIPKDLREEWDGVLTFAFNGQDEEVNFLYKKESNGLRLAVAKVSSRVNDLTGVVSYTVSRPTNSMVIFFKN